MTGIEGLAATLARAFANIGLAIFLAVSIAATPAAAQSLPNANAARLPIEASATHYRVNVGDELDIFVWGEERMQRAVRIQPDGTFAFPLAGTIEAAGRGVSEIAADIRERISVNYRAAPPDVTVSVRDAIQMRFYVIGKVRTPGSFTSGTPVNILQALSMAGGPAEFADIKNSVIMRQRPDGSQLVEPVQLATLLKGRKAMKGGTQASLPALQSGDVLVVP